MKIAFNIVVSLQLVAIIHLQGNAMPTLNTDPIAFSPSTDPIQNDTIEFTSTVDPTEVSCRL